MKELIKLLKKNHKTVSTMESCTGGALASCFTDIAGVLEFGAVVYASKFKIKMGVDPKVIDKYSVYSMETAQEMSLAIAKFSKSNYGVGITGHIDNFDDLVYISIYDSDLDKYDNFIYKTCSKRRRENKHKIIDEVVKHLREIIMEED